MEQDKICIVSVFSEGGYLLYSHNHNLLWFSSKSNHFNNTCRVRRTSLVLSVIALVIALTFIGKIHALPGSLANEAGASNREAELSPETISENVNVVSPAEDNNIAIPISELLALIGGGRNGELIPVHFLHLGVTDTDIWKEHPCFYSVMRSAVATAHPNALCGDGIVQYLHASININASGGSTAGVGNADMSTQRLTWFNNDRRVSIGRWLNKIDFEPGSLLKVLGLKLTPGYRVLQAANYTSQNGNQDQQACKERHSRISFSLYPYLLITMQCLAVLGLALFVLYLIEIGVKNWDAVNPVKIWFGILFCIFFAQWLGYLIAKELFQ
ncbi:MAG: hypothetical protein ABSA39_21630 [Edaphobacter sp.]|jgi:hypothetical protein|uniref:hypothetical protein n=1 Tax=Terracidiphilus sp. TaxID=1964191 RepID=UPI003C1343DE